MTAALAVSQPVNMPGRNTTVDLEEIRSLSSDYSISHQTMLSADAGLFSFSQTEPTTDYQFPSWGMTVGGTQNPIEFPDTGSSHSGEHEEIVFTSGTSTPRGARLDQTQAVEGWSHPRIASVVSGGHAMSRMDSSRSSASTLSRSSQLSLANSTGNTSAYRLGTQPTGSLTGMNSLLMDDATSVASYWGEYPLDMGNIGLVDGATFPVADVNPMQIIASGLPMGSDVIDSPSLSWDCFSAISRTSSPSTVDDGFNVSLSPHSSPEVICQSPTMDRTQLVTEEYTILAGSRKDELARGILPGRRASNDGEARSDPLYKDAKPAADGLYHCPFEDREDCTHKPEKLKCNYDKFVDSHLKPYVCKVASCNGARFSSTACLLRHEREAHGWHGHGEKPFSCTYPGCDRAQPGNGFPRQWNLKDHMKRVHNDVGSASGSPPSAAQQPAKNRKRKTDGLEVQTATTRKTAVKAMAAPEAQRISAKPLIDEWMNHRQAVESILKSGLNKPEDLSNITQITAVQEHLTAMAKMTTEWSTKPRLDIMPAPRTRGYTG